ncbi:hypothetical protein CAPTEDRAFT_216602 [Capitella teleta]|uniref:G-protein coupled receptors family 1 profile domain-containing protein n=1 Tax=Capitella teleta TaxID=283909 RepID=R7U6K3_CAPTE|nr:hypothetical protein CAPTEDRAFT_216602 [Capitella teleta]|eukprot:ELU01965.1 hypothetical protein CAPTEDRAFT_216602 [Capitella teleta]
MELHTEINLWSEDTTQPYSPNSSSLSEEEIRRCRIYYCSVRVVLGGLLFVFGIIGNMLTILVMRAVPRRSATIRALLFLAAADIFVIVQYGVMAVSVPLLGLLKMPSRTAQLALLRYAMPTGQIVNLISVFITVIVTWQRYISVCLPHKTHYLGSSFMVNSQVLFITVGSILFHLPMYFQDEYISIDGSANLVKRAFAKRASYSIFYSVVLVHLIRYFLPITLLIYMAYGLLKELGKSKPMIRIVDSSRQRAKLELTVSLIVVVIVFIICHSFAPSRQVLMLIYEPYSQAIQCGGTLFYFGPLDLISILINSSSNFLIFVVCAKGFRKRLIILCCKRKIANPNPTLDVDPENTHQGHKMETFNGDGSMV